MNLSPLRLMLLRSLVGGLVLGGTLTLLEEIGLRSVLHATFSGTSSHWGAAPDTPRWAELGISQNGPRQAVTAEHFWQSLGPGLEVTEVAVFFEGEEVDRLLLARVDPGELHISVHHDRSTPTITQWQKRYGADVVINGSYYDQALNPATPLRSGGRWLGPSDYEATHGVLLASTAASTVAEVTPHTWRTLLGSTDDGFVSYPLLTALNRTLSVPSRPRGLANRSFVSQDSGGRIVFGTTYTAFFSLSRFSQFLQSSGLDFGTTLNLDGGPVACQIVSSEHFYRNYCGPWEVSENSFGQLRIQKSTPADVPNGLPIVLMARRRS